VSGRSLPHFLIEGVKQREDMGPHSRDLNRPSFASFSTLLKQRGRGECRVRAAPMARLQQEKQAAVTTVSARHRHSPRNGLRLIRALPGVPLLNAHIFWVARLIED
jgi:hypothetical protein